MRSAVSIPVVLSTLMAVACGGSGHSGAKGAGGPEAAAANVDLFPLNRSKVRGAIRLVATPNGVHFRGRITGLGVAKYGFGVREGTDCGPNGSTAGAYFEAGNRIAPLGRIEDLHIEKTEGTNLDRVEAHLKLSGPHSIVGRTLVIEAWPTDPNVEANRVPMIACGVIQPE